MKKKHTLGMGSLPFADTFSDSLDMVKKIWGVTGLPTLPSASGMVQFAQNLPQTLPSMIAPTLDVEEIDKRIADLRAVEQWLNLNVNMLRTTIQSLEVQRNTIATLRSFGGAMLTTMAKPEEMAKPAPAPAPWPPSPMPARPPAPTSSRRRKPAAHAAAATLPLNPAAWWGTLQEQFNKVAASAAAQAEKSEKAEKDKVNKPAPAKSKRRRRPPA